MAGRLVGQVGTATSAAGWTRCAGSSDEPVTGGGWSRPSCCGCAARSQNSGKDLALLGKAAAYFASNPPKQGDLRWMSRRVPRTSRSPAWPACWRCLRPATTAGERPRTALRCRARSVGRFRRQDHQLPQKLRTAPTALLGSPPTCAEAGEPGERATPWRPAWPASASSG